MSKNMLLTAIFSLFLTLKIVKSQCPRVFSPCVCESTIFEPVVIQCASSGSIANTVRLIENAKNTVIDSLIIKYTPIPKLQAGSFREFRIKRLVLNKNNLSEMDPDSFDGYLLEILTELDLKDNRLRGIPQSGITKLKNLRKLYLSKNRISALPANAFLAYESRKSIEKLDLSNNLLLDSGLVGPFGRSALTDLISLSELSLEANSLSTIPSGVLVNQRLTLKNLNLGLNNIKSIQAGQLDFPNLESLSLEYSGIENLSGDSFRMVPNLKFLYLTGNKFTAWDSGMYRYIGKLEILSIGETPIRVIPSDAFENIPRLTRLEMSESAVATIERGAFQRIPNVKAIILNKNQLTRVTTDTFQGLKELSTLDLYANSINSVADFSWSNLPVLRHLDLSFNNISVLYAGTFQNTFNSTDSRSLYLCGNPWSCDDRIDWLRNWLRANSDITIDKPGTPQCIATCSEPDWFPPNWPIRDPNPSEPQRLPTKSPETTTDPQGLPTPAVRIAGSGGVSVTVWMILGIILGILLLAILLLLLVRYLISRKGKKDKDEDEIRRMINSSTSSYQLTTLPRSHLSGGIDLTTDTVDLNLPRASTMEVKDHYIGY